MPIVTGISFKTAGKVYYFNPDRLDLKPGDRVIVKTSRGMEMGEVILAPHEVAAEEISTPLKKVLRRVTPEDEQQLAANKSKEREAFEIAQKKIAEHELPMKLIGVEYTFDASKIIFYFTAEDRVDFRSLVKDLAAVFKTRIELRQVGVRDEAKMIGGLGPCGRRLCCSLFLHDFEPVSIKMAKEQDLPLNPIKISGICGRLMCCLKYENDVYEDFKKRAPKKGKEIETPEGVGVVVDYNVPRNLIVVELPGGRRVAVSLSEIEAQGS